MFAGITSILNFYYRSIISTYLSKEYFNDYYVIEDYLAFIQVLYQAQIAMSHYFTKHLDEDCLQNSHMGTPCQKWAKVSNDDFSRLDQAVKSLLKLMQLHICVNKRDKKGCFWTSIASNAYFSCIIDIDDQKLRLASIDIASWTDENLNFIAYCSDDIITVQEIDISNRSVLSELQRNGILETKNIMEIIMNLKKFIENNYKIQDITRIPYYINFNPIFK